MSENHTTGWAFWHFGHAISYLTRYIWDKKDENWVNSVSVFYLFDPLESNFRITRIECRTIQIHGNAIFLAQNLKSLSSNGDCLRWLLRMTPCKHLKQLLVSDVMTAVTTRRSSWQRCIGVSVDSFVRGGYCSGKGRLVTLVNAAKSTSCEPFIEMRLQQAVRISTHAWYNVFWRTHRCVQFKNDITLEVV